MSLSASRQHRTGNSRFKSVQTPWVYFFGLVFCTQVALGGGGPENILLVVNRQDPSSLLIANHYIALRKIPSCNVLYLDDVPNAIVTDLDPFRNKILRPIVNYINEQKLAAQIDYVVYSTGFPTAVKVSPHVSQVMTAAKVDGKSEMGRVLQGAVSTTSLTYFALPVLADQGFYIGLDTNLYYRRDAAQLLVRPFASDLNTKYLEAVEGITQGDLDESIRILEELVEANPAQVALNYQLARAYGRKNDPEKASQWLGRAVNTGWLFRDVTANDPAFEAVRKAPLFDAIASRIPNVTYDFVPTMGFSSRYSWAPNGSINGSQKEGANYLLSTMLGTTTQFGNSEQEIINYLTRSVGADGTSPKGTFAFAKTGDVRTKTRVPNFDAAIRELKAMGETCQVVNGPLPKGQKLSGVMLGAASFDWASTQSQILPGAIADNLTSFGAKFEIAAQTKLSELLRFGAAGSSGTVTEPFALQQKFPHPMIHVHYRRGCSLAEAFYQSVSGPYQLLVVGDALCRPWAPKATLLTEGLDDDQTVNGSVAIKVSPESDTLKFGMIEIFLDGRLTHRMPAIGEVNFDSTKMTDGFHELRIVCVANDLIQNRYHKIIPFNVDNFGKRVTVNASQSAVDEKQSIVFTVNANWGKRVELLANGNLLKSTDDLSGEIRVSAASMGRGTVSVQAVALDGEGNKLFSAPVSVEVKGKLATETVSNPGGGASGKPAAPKPGTKPTPKGQKKGASRN